MVFRKMDRKKKTDMARRVVTHCQIVVQKLIFGNESLNPHRKPVEPRAVYTWVEGWKGVWDVQSHDGWNRKMDDGRAVAACVH
jgi:hypothetical protein